MKLIVRLLAPFLLLLAASVTTRAAEPSPETLYVTVETFEPILFERLRFAALTGDEIILSTLRQNAEKEAGFAGVALPIVVLADGEVAPAGSRALRFLWSESAVTAEYSDAQNIKPKYLGVVSRTELADHPDHAAMQREITRAGSSLARRDATLRASLRVQLYVALQRVKRELPAAK